MIRTQGLTKRYGADPRRRRTSTWTSREGDVYGFLGANGSGKTTTVRMLLGLVLATSGSIEVLGRPMPARAREVLPHVGALVEGPAAYAAPVGAGEPRAARRDGPGRRAREPGPPGRRRARRGRARRRRRAGRCAPTPSACGSGSGSPPRCCGAPRLLVLDEPTNGLDPQGIREIRDLLLRPQRRPAPRSSCPATCSPRSSRCATRVGVLDRGRLVMQERLDVLQRPTGRTLGADARRRRGRGRCSTGRSSRTTREQPAGPRRRRGRAQRPAGRGRACGSTMLGAGAAHASRTSCSRRPTAGLGPGGARRDRRRAAQAGAQPADLGDDRAHRRAADAGGGAARAHRPRAAARHRPGVPVGRADRRHALPAGRDRDRPAAVPAGRGRGHRRRDDRRRGAAGHPALRADPAGRPDPAAGGQAGRGDGASCWSRCSWSPRRRTSSASLLLGGDQTATATTSVLRHLADARRS